MPRALAELSDAELLSAANYNTPLSTSEEQGFQSWKQQHAPADSGGDYDLRGAYKAGVMPAANGHWPDTYKKPNHPTFSNESIYAADAPDKAGHWEGETYVPAPKPISEMSDEELVARATAPTAAVSSLTQFDDGQLSALAVHQGLLQPDQAEAAIVEKKRAERAPVARGIAETMSIMTPVPASIGEALLTRGGKAGDVAAETLTPIVGGIAGAGAGALPGLVAGGATGGLVGDAAAQMRQYLRGERDQSSKGELVASTIASAIPIGGQMLKAPAKVILTRAGQAAAIAAGSQAVGQVIDTGRVDLPSLAQTGMLGALFGAGAGAVESNAARKLVLKAVRRTPEFSNFEGTDAELVAAVKQKMAESQPTPVVPVERNVTGTAEMPPAGEIPPGPSSVKPGVVAPEVRPGPTARAGEFLPVPPLSALTTDELLTVANRTRANTDRNAMLVPHLADLPQLSDAELTILQGQLEDEAKRPFALQDGVEIPAAAAPVVKGQSLRFGPRADGETDIIDAIHDTGGVPRPPPGAKGGEWDGHAETFRGPARLLTRSKPGQIDQYLQDLASSYPQFEHLAKDPDAFYAAVTQALRARTTVKAAVTSEQQSQKFMMAALEGKGRGVREPRAGDPVPVDSLNVGAMFDVKGEPFTVVDVNPDTGAVTVKDGPRFGTQELPAGAALHADADTIKNPETSTDFAPNEAVAVKPITELTDAELQAAAARTSPGLFDGGETGGDTTFNLAGDTGQDFAGHMDAKAEAAAARAAAAKRQGDLFGGSPTGAAASPGRSGKMPPPPAERPGPADDPTFSQLPIQLPEMVQFYKLISGGQVPKIVEQIRILHGQALGVFRYREGAVDSGRIELRADLFNLLSVQEKNQLLQDAVKWATLMKQANASVNFKEAVSRKFHDLVKAAEAKALTEDPRRALDVFGHEIGHFVDFLPNGTITRGNILGRIASLKGYLKAFIGEHPSINNQPPNENERAKLRRAAEKELRAQVQEIVETIRREVPVYASLPITADHITSILKTAQREEFPELYDWFAGLDRADKAAVLRAAMKGIVDERAARLAARKQVGTKTIEETITRRSGPEPTPEAIRARYDELLRAELKRRGLISERDIKQEIHAAIAWWQGVDQIPNYFKTAEEMYAETFSILLNNPAALAKRAPTFYRAFFNYLERKPIVKAAYEKLQSDIRSGAIQRQRVENLRDAWREDEDAGLLKDIAGSRLDWRKVRDTLRLLFDRQHGPIEARALRRIDSPQSKGVLAALKDYLYRMTAIEGYARELNQKVEGTLAEHNLRHDDLAEYMFHQRIAGGDRQQIANAQGWSPNTSAARLEEMQRDLGPARYGALEAAQLHNREIYERRVVDLLQKAKVLTPELLEVIRTRTLYATFAKTRQFNPLEHSTIEGMLEQQYGKDATARIYRQIGYLGDIRSPYLAMTQKAFALINFAYKQMALKSVVNFLQEHEPTLISEAEQRFTGQRWEPRIVETSQVGTLLTLNDGKLNAYYVPREIAETMQHGSPLETMIVGLAHRALTWPKALMTELNAGFWPVAFLKDLATLGLQLPKGLAAYKNVPAAYRAARATFTGEANATADAALQRLMVISRADPRGEHLGHPDEMTRLLLRMGQNPQLWDAEVAKISRLMRTWLWYKRQGATLERTAKIAGMLHLDSEAFASMPEWMKKRMVNELAGSPDFLERGRAAPIIEVTGGPIFYNAWLQGIRAFKRAAQQDPRGFWTKFLTFFGLPALAFYAFEKGLLDFGMTKEDAEDHRDMLRSVPERDKLRGFVIPLFWADRVQGKVAYIVLPFPDQVRYLHAGLRKAAQTIGGDGEKSIGLGSFVQFGGQDLPGQNPMISEGVKWWQFAALGQNPYDSFRGRQTLSDDVMKSGQGGTELAKQTAANLTGGILYKYRPQAQGDSPTGIEKFIDIPGVSNVLGRWLRVSNAGLNEETDRTIASTVQHEAQLRLVADEMTRKTMAGEPWTKTENILSQNEPYLAQYLMSHLGKVMENATGPEMRAFNRATSPQQKADLMQAWNAREKAKSERLQMAK